MSVRIAVFGIEREADEDGFASLDAAEYAAKA